MATILYAIFHLILPLLSKFGRKTKDRGVTDSNNDFSVIKFILNMDCALRSTVYLRIVTSKIVLIENWIDYPILALVLINLSASLWKILEFATKLYSRR